MSSLKRGSYKIQISVIEFLGAETLITFEFQDGLSGMISTPGLYDANMGDYSYISFPTEKIHIFDSETEANLI